jgi:general secretion pathway protein G
MGPPQNQGFCGAENGVHAKSETLLGEKTKEGAEMGKRKKRNGFMLVEILIVVAIIGILAAIVIPQFVNITADAKESALAANLNMMRNGVELFYHQHNSKYPASIPAGDGTTPAANSEGAFRAHLLNYSDAGGKTATTLDRTKYAFGPYMKKDIPRNPINGLSTVKVLASGAGWPAAADNSTGWICNPADGRIAANLTGADSKGVNYYDY